jgi:hypothetical protein
MKSGDPIPRHVRQSGEIIRRREYLGLEATHLTRRGSLLIHGAPSDDLAQHGIERQALGVIDVLVPGKPTEYRMPTAAGGRPDYGGGCDRYGCR